MVFSAPVFDFYFEYILTILLLFADFLVSCVISYPPPPPPIFSLQIIKVKLYTQIIYGLYTSTRTVQLLTTIGNLSMIQ